MSNLIHAHGICHACVSKLHICHGNIAVMEVRLLGWVNFSLDIVSMNTFAYGESEMLTNFLSQILPSLI